MITDCRERRRSVQFVLFLTAALLVVSTAGVLACDPASSSAEIQKYLRRASAPGTTEEARQHVDCVISHYSRDSFEVASAFAIMAQTIVKRTPEDIDQAREWADRASEVLEFKLDPSSITMVYPLELVRDVYWSLQDETRASQVEIRLEQVVDSSPSFRWEDRARIRAECADRLGRALRLGAAEDKFKEALQIAEAHERPHGEHVANCLYGYSKLLMYLAGEPWRALPLLQRALSIRQTAAPDPVEIVRLVNAIGVVYQRLHDLEPAREWLQRGLTARLSLAGYPEPDGVERMRTDLRSGAWKREQSEILMHVGQSLFNLGDLAKENADGRRARDYFERALETWEIARPNIPLDIAEARAALAEVRLAAGSPEIARPLAQAAVRSVRLAIGPDRHSLPHLLVIQARVEFALRHTDEALALVREALTAEAAQSGTDRSVLASMRLLESECLESLGRVSEAIDSAAIAERILHDSLVLGLRALPERVALDFADGQRQALDRLLHLSLTSKSPQSVASAWEALVRSRAIVLDEIAERRRLASASYDPASAAAIARLRAALQARALLLTSEDLERARIVTPARLEQARRDIEQAERELAALELPRRSIASAGRTDTSELARTLAPGAVLVSYARTSGSESAPSRYVAFVLHPDGKLRLVPLAESRRVEQLVKRWLQHAGAPADPLSSDADELAELRQSGSELRRILIDPVLQDVPTTDSLWLVPDGALHLVNFSALSRADGRFMIEGAPMIAVVTAERDLLDTESRSTKSKGLLAVGGPRYDATPITGPSGLDGNGVQLRSPGAACFEFSKLEFTPLDYSRREALDVASAWRRDADSTGDAIVLTGSAAQESAVKQLAPGRRAVHLATHGFMIRGGCAATAGSAMESPLLLAGLALAGANRRSTQEAGNANDGLLTADEVAMLPLEGVEWVVLSACDTALGDLSASDGTLGLKRAFRVAGVGAQISSLWRVSDDDARGLMVRFYRAALDDVGVADALQRAMRETLNERRRRGLSLHPRHWAPFVASVSRAPSVGAEASPGFVRMGSN